MNNHDKLRSIIDSTPKAGWGKLEYKIKSNFPELHKEIIDFWKYKIEAKFIEKIEYYLFQQDVFCPESNRKKFNGLTKGYSCCEKHCICAKQKYTTTMLERYGTEYPNQNSAIKEKMYSTLMARFKTNKLSEVNKEKRKFTNLEKYGSEYPLQSYSIRQKIRENLKEKTGHEYPFQNENIQYSIQEFWKKRNNNGQRSYVRTAQDGKKYSLNYAQGNFKNDYDILFEPDQLTLMLRKFSINELSIRWNCCRSTIEHRINKYNLIEFQNKPSYYEELIAKLLDDNNIEYIRNTRKIIKPKELDFFIPKFNFAIEFCGLNWHGDKSGRGKNYHLDKFNSCSNLEIDLIQIFQDEWDDNSSSIKNLILSKVGIDTENVELHNDIMINDFIEVIPDKFITSRKLNELLNQLMTYNKDIILYDDLRYSNSKILHSLGFKEMERIEPIWFYSKGCRRYSQQDINIEFADQYDKIYDCGYSVYYFTRIV